MVSFSSVDCLVAGSFVVVLGWSFLFVLGFLRLNISYMIPYL